MKNLSLNAKIILLMVIVIIAATIGMAVTLNIRDASSETLPVLLIMAAVCIVLAVIVSWLLKPLKHLSDTACDIAKGNVHVNNRPDIGGSKELAQISQAFREIINNLITLDNAFEESEKAICYGNVNYRLKSDSVTGIYSSIMAGANRATHELAGYMDVVNEPIFLIDKNYRILFANETAARFTRTKAKEIAGRHLNELLRCDITTNKILAECMTSGKETYCDIVLQLNDDETFEMQMHCVHLKDSRTKVPVGGMILLADFTEIRETNRLTQKLAEYRSAQSEKLASAISSAFEQGNLALQTPVSTYDNDTREIAAEYDALQDILKRSLNIIKGYIDELSAILGAMSQKNFDNAISRTYIGDFTAIKDSVNVILQDMNLFFGELLNASGQVREGTFTIAEGIQEIASSTVMQTETVMNVSNSVYQVAEKIQLNMATVEKAAKISAIARQNASLGDGQMAEMLAAMDEIRASSSTISDIIKTINDIAFQTNLLALNASVEAARAGEHGRGFAVVAEEVRNLALRSAEAVQRSSALIETSMQKVGSGVQIARNTAKALSSIVEAVEDMNETIQEINASSVEQNRAIVSIEQSLGEINNMMQQNSNVVTQNAAAAQEVTSQADGLQNMVSAFKLRRG